MLSEQKKQIKRHRGAMSLKALKDEAEKEIIMEMLEHYGRSVQGKKEAAKQLVISLTTLYARMSAYNVK